MILFLVLTIAPELAFGVDAVKDSTAGPVDPSATGDLFSANSDETLLLEVEVNGNSIGKIGEFTLRHGKLMVRPAELRDLGFRVPDSRSAELRGLIALSDLPGLTWTLDQKNQELHITVSDNRLLPTILQPAGKERPEDYRVIESGTGTTLNYDIVNTFANGNAGATGSMDLRVYSPWGVASSGWLAYAGANTSGSDGKSSVRLDSVYTFADVNTLRRYSLGDFITAGLSWSRPVHIEGAQIRKDFSMRPDLVTFPMPSIGGSAAVPSTVDILADGNLVMSSQVAPGPFETPQLPVMSGAGTISMTVTNALGQQMTVTQPFYAGTALLAPGLQTYAVQAGLVRRNWGSASFDYGKAAGAATYRRGLTPRFTIEGSVEGTPGAVLTGGGGVAQIGNLGVANFAFAAGGGAGHPGALISAGAQRIGRAFSLGASAIIANRNYRDVASMNGAGIPRKQISAFTSVSLRRYGSAGVAYAGIDEDASPVPVQFNTLFAEHSHVFSANYSLQFRRMSIYVSEYKNVATAGGSAGLQAGLTIPFGRRSSVDVSATSGGDAQLQVQKAATEVGEWGYQAYASTGNTNHEFGQVQYKAPLGLFTVGIDNNEGATTLRMESQGAVSFADRTPFLSNAIYDSFAVVDTSPVSHVHVFQENREVGVTNSSGKLLVPDLRSFDLNHITIAATDIPVDATINDASREMRPQDRSGVVVRFPIEFSRGALLILVDECGDPVPLGSTATLRATNVTVPIGYDGAAFVKDLSEHNALTVERADGRRCTAAFDYRPSPGDIPSIGPLRCVMESQ